MSQLGPEPTALLALSDQAPAERLVTVVAQAGARPIAVAGDAAELARLLRTSRPDVVLVDLGLARTARRELAQVKVAFPDIPLVAVCCDRSPASLAAALSVGIAGFVPRDAGPAQMRPIIAAARAGQRAVAPELLDPLLEGATAQLRAQGADLIGHQDRADALRRRLAPGALFPVFQPIADLRGSCRLGWLALTRFSDSAPEQTAHWFAEARALGLTAELELAAAQAASSEIDRLPAPSLLFMKASCTTVAQRGLEDVLDGDIAARVVIELSGIAELEETDAFNDAVDRLRHRGVRFAVDETGAGFGPLDHVLDLSPAFVRLAGGLTRGIDVDRTRRALAMTVISFASHLGAKVIADQIETAEELDALRRLGVGYGLGFHIGRPEPLPARMPVAEQAAVPGAAADPGATGEDAERDHPQVAWARARPVRDLALPPRSAACFEAASAAMLGLVEQHVPGSVPYVALLDRPAGLARVVDVGPGGAPTLEVGMSFPLKESGDERAATGRAPQAVPQKWAVVPFAGAPERPVATLSAVGSAAFGPDAIDFMRDAAGLLAGALAREHGGDPERLATALREISGRDRFTGVLNGHRFREVLAEANARAVAAGGGTYVVAFTLPNLDGLADRMGQAVRGLVLKDVARSLALEAERVDAIARVGPTTYGCVLFARRSSEVDYFCRSAGDRVAALGRRRGATVELRHGVERLGLRATSEDAWQAAVDRAFAR
jgi:EAL domain-containing protein (putative c-di-GMP-specific phosphodiesterase class I)/GGDEF domain-containing protein/AmiR/NasT family two-component response regulator